MFDSIGNWIKSLFAPSLEEVTNQTVLLIVVVGFFLILALFVIGKFTKLNISV